MAKRKKALTALFLLVTLSSAVWSIFSDGVYRPTGLFAVGLVEWGLATLWAMASNKKDPLLGGLITMVNAYATYGFVSLTSLNPHEITHIFSYGAGSAIGGMLAIKFSNWRERRHT